MLSALLYLSLIHIYTINYMAGEISAAERMQNDFISSVSHELRTPLTAIKGWSETLRQGGSSDEELMTKGLDVISSEAERLSGIVEELSLIHISLCP